MPVKFIFSNAIGSFVLDDKFKILDEVLFGDARQYNNRADYEEKLRQKHKDAVTADETSLRSIMLSFKDKKYFPYFHGINLSITKKQIKESVSKDILIVQAISAIEEIDKAANLLINRAREWYSLYNPEASNKIENHERFIALITSRTKKQLLKELNIPEEESMGADLTDKDISQALLLAGQISGFYKLKGSHEDYMREIEKEACPNFMEVAGPAIAAKLIAHAGSIRRLVEMPASTIQVLGAEKALFRHMRNKKRNLPPKYGIIREHQLIQKSERKMQAKAARGLADKLSIAIKVDYFKGKFIGDKLKKELMDKLKVQY